MTRSSTARAAAPGRPREFDLDDAVRDALAVFRRLGYHGASMVHLLEGAKLSRGSLYKAFPDKRALFFAAFDLYAGETQERLAGKLAQGNGREGIRLALLHHAHVAAQSCDQKGCVITTATAELLPDDEEARARVAAYFARFRALFAEAVRRGQSEGVIDFGHDAEALGRYFETIVQGMRMLAKTGASESDLRSVVATAMLTISGRG